MTRIQPVCLVFLLLAACGELSRTPGSGDAGVDAGVASPRTTCEHCITAIARCVNAECMIGCVTDDTGRCLGSERCVEGACQPDVAPTCDEKPCNADQFCIATYCLGKREEPCDPALPQECQAFEFCEPAARLCVSLPPCDADGTCRLGNIGAVCNRGVERLDLEKFRDLCLVGRCTSNADCPSPRTCQAIGANPATPLVGVCR